MRFSRRATPLASEFSRPPGRRRYQVFSTVISEALKLFDKKLQPEYRTGVWHMKPAGLWMRQTLPAHLTAHGCWRIGRRSSQ